MKLFAVTFTLFIPQKRKQMMCKENCLIYRSRFHHSFHLLDLFFFIFFFIFGVPHLATCIFHIFYNEPELGAEINPGMVLTPLPSSIGLDGDQSHDLPTVSRVLYR